MYWSYSFDYDWLISPDSEWLKSPDANKSSLSKQEYIEPVFKYMMIKINQSVLEERDNDPYETVRSAWKVNLNKAKQYKYCLNCISKNQKKRIVSDPLLFIRKPMSTTCWSHTHSKA